MESHKDGGQMQILKGARRKGAEDGAEGHALACQPSDAGPNGSSTAPESWTWEELRAVARCGLAPGERRPPPNPVDLRLVVDCERWAAVGVDRFVAFPLLLKGGGSDSASAEEERLRRKLVVTWSALRVFGPGCIALDDDTRSLEDIFVAMQKAFADGEALARAEGIPAAEIPQRAGPSIAKARRRRGRGI